MDPPVLPSFRLPDQVLSNPPDLPRPTLDAPTADLPSYKPILVPSNALMVLEGTKSEKQEEEEGRPQPKEVQIPWTNYRSAVRTKCTEREATINACADSN